MCGDRAWRHLDSHSFFQDLPGGFGGYWGGLPHLMHTPCVSSTFFSHGGHFEDFSHEGPSYGGRCMFVPEITRLTKEKDKPLLEAVRAMDVENPGDVE